MDINYKEEILLIGGKEYQMRDFKAWFMNSYEPLLAKYHIKGSTYDWHAILSDVQTNGVIELFAHQTRPNE